MPFRLVFQIEIDPNLSLKNKAFQPLPPLPFMLLKKHISLVSYYKTNIKINQRDKITQRE